MSSIEAVIVTVIFLVPGFMTIELDNRLYSREGGNNFEIEKIINALILSLVSVLISLAVLNVFKIENIKSIDELSKQIGNFDFIFKYTLIVIVSIPATEIVYILYRKSILLFMNLFYKLQGREITELNQKTGWEYIFENKDINTNDYCVEIVKNGNMITRGYLRGYSPASAKDKELTFVCTNEFDEYFKADKDKSGNEKMFYKIDFEHYDISNDILIKFYNLDKLNAYLDEYEKSSKQA